MTLPSPIGRIHRTLARTKAIVAVLLVLVVILAPGPSQSAALANPPAPGPPPQPLRPFPPVDVTASSVAVIDGETGQLIYGRNPHERRPPASITKIVTAIVALEHDHLSRMTTSYVNWWTLVDSTVMGLFRGERLSIEDLLYGLMLPSGNDAAIALTYAVAGSPTHFVALMNDKVGELGLRNTHFVNPHGLDEPDHYTSAYDIAMLARYAMTNPDFARIAATKRIDVRGVGVYPLRNTNRFLWQYPGAEGVKNGFTDDARQTLVGSVMRDGRRIFVAVLGSEDYVGDAARLADYFYDNDIDVVRGLRAAQGGGPVTLTPSHDQSEFAQPWIEVAGSPTGQVPRALRRQ